MAELEKTPQKYNDYISGLFAVEDEALLLAREEMEREGLPKINVSVSEGKLLHTSGSDDRYKAYS